MLDENMLGGAALAYLGDAVLELMTREYLLESGISDVGHLNGMALDYVRATAQSDAVGRILPMLDETETAVYKRGRNVHGISIPKSASAGQYRRATGLEALFAFLYLRKQNDRMKELFCAGFTKKSEDRERPDKEPLRDTGRN